MQLLDYISFQDCYFWWLICKITLDPFGDILAPVVLFISFSMVIGCFQMYQSILIMAVATVYKVATNTV